MLEARSNLAALDSRSREVFRRLVESYLENGEPVGSRTLARTLDDRVSAATVRNVMQDLELLGLLNSPHVSSGRVPTQVGLRLFVDAILEVQSVSGSERAEIDRSLEERDRGIPGILDRAGSLLSNLSQGASLVLAPKSEAPIKHIEFVSLAPDRSLVVLVTADGNVENRLFNPPIGLTPAAMQTAANFLNAILHGRTLSEMKSVVKAEIAKNRAELDALAQSLIETGAAAWAPEPDGRRDRLIVRGRANLLDETSDAEQLERVRTLFDDLERKRDLAQLLELSEDGDGVRVFIGSENKLFSLSGSSLVVAPYMDADRNFIGAVGVIGPTRLNYGRVVPIVDYTAQLVGRLVSSRSQG